VAISAVEGCPRREDPADNRSRMQIEIGAAFIMGLVSFD
jgi:hypothetical protein